MKCEAVQHSDSKRCSRCQLQWDINDPCPPECKAKQPLMTVPEILRAAAATYEERNKQYGENYKKIGATLAALFPNGIGPLTDHEWNQFATWFMVYCKTIRYAVNIGDGGHLDSAHDTMVYAAMLQELTQP